MKGVGLLFVLYVVFAATGMLFIKMGGAGASLQLSLKLVSLQMNPLLLLGMLFYIISFVLYIFLLQKADLNYIIPLCAGVTNVVAVLFGILILKEKLQPLGAVGVALVIIGVTLMTLVKAK